MSDFVCSPLAGPYAGQALEGVQQRMRNLIVEDEPHVRIALQRAPSAPQHDVVACVTVAEALSPVTWAPIWCRCRMVRPMWLWAPRWSANGPRTSCLATGPGDAGSGSRSPISSIPSCASAPSPIAFWSGSTWPDRGRAMPARDRDATRSKPSHVRRGEPGQGIGVLSSGQISMPWIFGREPPVERVKGAIHHRFSSRFGIF